VTQEELARTIALQAENKLTTADYHTQNKLFNGEWLFGTYLMGGIGLCQVVQQHPETFTKWQPAIEQSIRQLLSPGVREFDRRAWNADPIESLAGSDGHLAYLGYINFLLSLYRQIYPTNEFAPLNDAITTTLTRRYAASASGLVATYPGEWYPVDNTPAIASIALHGKVTGQDYSLLLDREKAVFRQRLIDPKSHLLVQATNAAGEPFDAARGSGTTLGIFFLSRAWGDVAGELFQGVRQHLVSGVLTFGAIREYPHGEDGRRDIDSGPVIFGFGFSATGFGLAGARAFRDEKLFASLYASAILAGAPTRRDNRVDFLTAGTLGNSIMLAVLTTPQFTP